MTAPDLPAELKAALDARLQGLSRNDAAGRAALISQTYRDGGGSGTIRTEIDALAYALVRMPATYAAVTASLNALREITPRFAPASLLDVGAGPGTATWAAAEAFSSLKSFQLLDANHGLRALALDIGRGSVRLREMTYQRGDAGAALADASAADLVVAKLYDRRGKRRGTKYAHRADVDKNPRHAADRRTRHTGRICKDPHGAATTDRVGRACRRPLPARRRVPADCAGLVSLHTTPAAIARA